MVKSKITAPPLQTEISTKFKKALGLDVASIVHIAADNSGRPSCLIVHGTYGLIAIEIGTDAEDSTEVRRRLNLKVENLRNQLRSVSDLVIQNIVVVADSRTTFDSVSKTSFVVNRDQILATDWKVELQKIKMPASQVGQLQSRLWPAMTFKVDTYGGTADLQKEKRELTRAVLDAEQAKIALTDVPEAMIISGPPGSGKSLILAARARHLAGLHPDWNIVLVVYNRMLAKHFIGMGDLWPKNIQIVTLKNLLLQRGEKELAKLSSDYRDPDEANLKAAARIRKMKRSDNKADIDALLVDEWQDFSEPYVTYLLSCVRPGRGGSVFAGDKGQAIYTDRLPTAALKGTSVKNVTLKIPYRSTRQILDVAQALDNGYVIDGSNSASDGEPVNLIFATSWQLQAEAIAWEIEALLESDERKLGEIVVLCTTKSGAGFVERALNENEIPNVVHNKIWDDSDISHEKVNVMTIHGGKGFGFKVVFVMGFETLRDLDGSSERSKWGRVGYVAVTRAEDLLFILYKTETQFLRNLKKCKSNTIVSRSYPDDYRKKRK